MVDAAALLQALFAAGDAGNVEAFRDILSEDVMVHAPFGLSTVGVAGEIASWQKANSAIRDLRHEFLDVVASENKVAARCRVTGTVRGALGEISADGRAFEVDQALFAVIRDGRITELWEIVDTDALLNQLSG